MSSYDNWKCADPGDEELGSEDGYEMPANPNYDELPPEDE